MTIKTSERMIELCAKNDCTGCGACYIACPESAISMRTDAEGFLYPEINHDVCIGCNLCQCVCPVLKPVAKHPKVDGPLAVIAKSEELRMKSSSGGMFSLMASWIFGRGGVVYGAAMNKDYEIYHTKATNEEELNSLRGSKYAQSDTKRTFQEVRQYLKKQVKVLYTGTPCQIAGLYGYLGKMDTTNLYTSDLVCHGVPSSRAFRLYLEKLSQKENLSINEIKNFSFRNLKGWDKNPSFQTVDMKEYVLSAAKDIYMRLFLSSRLHRYSCYNCQYTTQERVGDITIADFWGIGKQKPFKYDISKGCSLVLLNTEKGRQLFEDISEDLDYEQRDWQEAFKENTQLYAHSVCPKDRAMVYSYLETHAYNEVYDHFFNTPYFRLHRLIGSVLRTLHLRSVL